MTVRPPRLLVAGPPLAQRLAALDATLLEAGARSPELALEQAARLRLLISEGAVTRPPAPATVVYRLSTGGHQQTGVVVDVSVEDYRSSRIRRHEATDPGRERLLVDFLAAARLELVPVTLTHRPRPVLRSLLAAVTTGEPDVHVVSDDGMAQTVWIEHSDELALQIGAELAGLAALYIADGHHRMAAAERYATRVGSGGGDRVSDFVLGALFPADEMRVLGYHRGCALSAGLSASDLVQALAEQPAAERVEEVGPAERIQPAPGSVPVYLHGRWYRLRLRTPGSLASAARASLDVVALEEGVLEPLFGAADPEITPLPGTFGAEDVARWCSDHAAMGFLLHPPGVDQVIAVADAGTMMPRKSTWFDPKARPGPLLRDLA